MQSKQKQNNPTNVRLKEWYEEQLLRSYSSSMAKSPQSQAAVYMRLNKNKGVFQGKSLLNSNSATQQEFSKRGSFVPGSNYGSKASPSNKPRSRLNARVLAFLTEPAKGAKMKLGDSKSNGQLPVALNQALKKAAAYAANELYYDHSYNNGQAHANSELSLSKLSMKSKFQNGTNNYGQKKNTTKQYFNQQDDDQYQLPRFQEMISQSDLQSQASRPLTTVDTPNKYHKSVPFLKTSSSQAPSDSGSKMQNRFEKPRKLGIEVNGDTVPLKETISQGNRKDEKQPKEEREHQSLHTSFKQNNHIEYCEGLHNIFHGRTSLDGSDQNRQCHNRIYAKTKLPLCKTHFQKLIKLMLMHQFKQIYRHCETAFSSMDMTGISIITRSAFLNCLAIQRVISDFNTRAQQQYKIDISEIEEYLNVSHMFDKQEANPQSARVVQNSIKFSSRSLTQPQGESTPARGSHRDGISGINYETFKKTFFPHLCHAVDDDEAGTDEEAQKMDTLFTNENDQETNNIQQETKKSTIDRINKIEKILREKFRNHFDSVRKAFLYLDQDHDGYVTVDEFWKVFGELSDINYNDLKKLVRARDSSGQGRINYEDFSSWVGGSIHQSEGFYFRHDSIKNPWYEQNLDKIEKDRQTYSNAEKPKTIEELKNTMIDKIKSQWKTILKAFRDFNKDAKYNGISENEFRFYVNHWGLKMTEEQFLQLFTTFDIDKDGIISYQDFAKSFGHEIHPGETLYFRQDKDRSMKQPKCGHEDCWDSCVFNKNYCSVHNKLYLEEFKRYFQKIYSKYGSISWQKFMKEIQKYYLPEDNDHSDLIELKSLEKVLLSHYNTTLSTSKRELFINVNGKVVDGKQYINVYDLPKTNVFNEVNKMYDAIELDENLDDDAVDTAGYIGLFHRDPKLSQNLINVTLDDLVYVFSIANKMSNIFGMINSVDKDRNGYVTNTELDDILKIAYPAPFEDGGLKDANLKPLMRKFASSANKVLIDYRQFRDFINTGLRNNREELKLKAQQKRLESLERLKKRVGITKPRLDGISNQVDVRLDKVDIEGNGQNGVFQQRQQRNGNQGAAQTARKREQEEAQKLELEKVETLQRKKSQIIRQTEEQMAEVRQMQHQNAEAVMKMKKETIQDLYLKEQRRPQKVSQENEKKHEYKQKRPNRAELNGVTLEPDAFDNNYYTPSALFQYAAGVKKTNSSSDLKMPAPYSSTKGLHQEIMRQIKLQGSDKNAQNEESSQPKIVTKMLPVVDNYQMLKNMIPQGASLPSRPCTTALTTNRKITTTPGKGASLNPLNELSMEKMRDPNLTIMEKTKSRNGGQKVYKTLNEGYQSKMHHLIDVQHQVNSNPKLSPLPTAGKTSYQHSTASQSNPAHANQAYTDKLSPQWTQIYRKLHSNDPDNQGVVNVQQFEKALRQTNTFLTRQEISAIKTHYGVQNSASPQRTAIQIDYDDLSQNVVGSVEKHHQRFDIMRKTHARLNQLKKGIEQNRVLAKNELLKQEMNRFDNETAAQSSLKSIDKIGKYGVKVIKLIDQKRRSENNQMFQAKTLNDFNRKGD